MRQELQEKLELKGRANFEERYLRIAIEHGLIEYTVFSLKNNDLGKLLNKMGKRVKYCVPGITLWNASQNFQLTDCVSTV